MAEVNILSEQTHLSSNVQLCLFSHLIVLVCSNKAGLQMESGEDDIFICFQSLFPVKLF